MAVVVIHPESEKCIIFRYSFSKTYVTLISGADNLVYNMVYEKQNTSIHYLDEVVIKVRSYVDLIRETTHSNSPFKNRHESVTNPCKSFAQPIRLHSARIYLPWHTPSNFVIFLSFLYVSAGTVRL